MKKIFVLIACEESQVETIAFRRHGFTAFSCDLQVCSGGHPEWHICGDCLKIIDGNCSFKTCDGRRHRINRCWDLVIAHPPCTYLSKVGAPALYKSQGVIDELRYSHLLAARKFFLKCLAANSPHVAVENPIPMKICNLPKPTTIVQPYEYGHPFMKKTLLWLKNLPPLMPTGIMAYKQPFMWSPKAQNDKNRRFPFAWGSKKRSRSFEGIAEAMAVQWGNVLLSSSDSPRDVVRD